MNAATIAVSTWINSQQAYRGFVPRAHDRVHHLDRVHGAFAREEGAHQPLNAQCGRVSLDRGRRWRRRR
jgi:succinate dehydrogenase/fumarate reductase flavoprotein subunit